MLYKVDIYVLFLQSRHGNIDKSGCHQYTQILQNHHLTKRMIVRAGQSQILPVTMMMITTIRTRDDVKERISPLADGLHIGGV